MFTAIHMNIISSEQRAEKKQNTLLNETQKKELIKALDTIDSVLDLDFIIKKKHKKITKDLVKILKNKDSGKKTYDINETDQNRLLKILKVTGSKKIEEHELYEEKYKNLYNIIQKMLNSRGKITYSLKNTHKNTTEKQKEIRDIIKEFTEFLITENIDSKLDLITNEKHKKIAKEILRASDEELYEYDIDGDKKKLTDIQKIVDVSETHEYDREQHEFYREEYKSLYNIIFNMFNMGNQIDYRVKKIHKNTQKNIETINSIIKNFIEFLITENIDSKLDLITNKEHKKIAKEILRASDEELYEYDTDEDEKKLTDIQKIVDVSQTGNRKDNKFYKEKDEYLYNIIFNMFNMRNGIDYRVKNIHKNTQKNIEMINSIIKKFTKSIITENIDSELDSKLDFITNKEHKKIAKEIHRASDAELYDTHKNESKWTNIQKIVAVSVAKNQEQHKFYEEKYKILYNMIMAMLAIRDKVNSVLENENIKEKHKRINNFINTFTKKIIIKNIDSKLDLITNEEHKKIAKEILGASDKELYRKDKKKYSEEWTNIQKIVTVSQANDREEYTLYKKDDKNLYDTIEQVLYIKDLIFSYMQGINKKRKQKVIKKYMEKLKNSIEKKIYLKKR